MPRVKRALSTTDANVSAVASKKGKSTAATDAKENDNSVDLTQEAAHEDSAKSKRAKKPKAQPDTSNTWICVCRAWSDIEAEKEDSDEDEDEEHEEEHDEDEEEAMERQRPAKDDPNKHLKCFRKGCVCADPIADHPNWKWIVTKEGRKMALNLHKEAWKRDQDSQGQYHYNDFSGYGFQEVVENMLFDFNKDYKKANSRSTNILWHHVEAMAHFLGTGDLMHWMMQDDGDRLTQAFSVIGTMVLSVLDILEKEGLFITDSEIKDIPLVLALTIEFARGNPAGRDEKTDWMKVVVGKAKKAGIELSDVLAGGVNDTIEELKKEVIENDVLDKDDEDRLTWENDKDAESEDEDDTRTWRKWDFLKEVCNAYMEYLILYAD